MRSTSLRTASSTACQNAQSLIGVNLPGIENQSRRLSCTQTHAQQQYIYRIQSVHEHFALHISCMNDHVAVGSSSVRMLGMQSQSSSRLTSYYQQIRLHSLRGINVDCTDYKQPLPLLSPDAQTCDNMPSHQHRFSAHPSTPTSSPLLEPSAAFNIGPFALHLG